MFLLCIYNFVKAVFILMTAICRELPGQGIEGTLPQQFSVLAGLEQLSLKFNRLHGVVIPGSWTSLEALKMM